MKKKVLFNDMLIKVSVEPIYFSEIKQLEFEVKRLHNPRGRADYQLEISSRFEILGDSRSNMLLIMKLM